MKVSDANSVARPSDSIRQVAQTIAKDYGAKQVGKTLEEISQETDEAAH